MLNLVGTLALQEQDWTPLLFKEIPTSMALPLEKAQLGSRVPQKTITL